MICRADRITRAASLAPLLAALACASPSEPRSGVTLLVTNGACVAQYCDSLRILGFPGNQPGTPGGYWSIDLGIVTTPTACLTLPPSATFRVIGLHEGGGADTTTVTWTTTALFSLGAQVPSASLIMASPTTTAFVPADAEGWRITLPGGSRATPSSACTP
jgi:hypothetical protein